MKVEIKYFAMCQEIAGKEAEVVEVPENTTTRKVWDILISRYPRLAPYRDRSRLAVNLEYVLTDTPLKEGDEICIIPPVSGG